MNDRLWIDGRGDQPEHDYDDWTIDARIRRPPADPASIREWMANRPLTAPVCP